MSYSFYSSFINVCSNFCNLSSIKTKLCTRYTTTKPKYFYLCSFDELRGGFLTSTLPNVMKFVVIQDDLKFQSFILEDDEVLFCLVYDPSPKVITIDVRLQTIQAMLQWINGHLVIRQIRVNLKAQSPLKLWDSIQ